MIRDMAKKTTLFVAKWFAEAFGLVAFISLVGGSLVWLVVLSAGGEMGTAFALLVAIPLHILFNILLFGLIAMYIQNNEYLRQIRDALSHLSGGQPLSDEEEPQAMQREVNFQKVAALLANRGFKCTRSNDKGNKTGFLAHHVERDETLKVQLKTRLVIDKKYLNEDLLLAFPLHGDWYFIEHDKLIDLVGENANYLNTPSWKVGGMYSTENPNENLLAALAEYRLSP